MAAVPEDDLPDSLRGKAVPKDDLPTDLAEATPRVDKPKEPKEEPRKKWQLPRAVLPASDTLNYPSASDTLSSLGNTAAGIGEIAMAGMSGMASSAAGGIAGLAGTVLSGPEGQGAAWSKYIQQKGTYQPQTETGKELAGVIAKPFEMASAGLGKAGRTVGDLVGPKTGAALETLGENAIDLAGAVVPLFKGAKFKMAGGAMPAADLSQTERALLKSKDKGYSVNPADVNPTLKNKTIQAIAGRSGVDSELAVKNAVVDTNKAKKALGLTDAEDLDHAAIKTVRDENKQAYDNIRSTQVDLMPDGAFQTALADVDAALHEAKSIYPEAFKDNALEHAKSIVMNPAAPPTPGAVIKLIQKYRKDASTILKRDNNTPGEIQAGLAHKDIANVLEDFLDRKLSENPATVGLVDDLRAAREKIAKSHDIEEVTNLYNGTVDAGKLAKIKEAGGKLSGDLEDIVQAWGARQRPKGISKADINASDSTKGQVVAHGIGSVLGGLAGAAGGGVPGAIGGATAGSVAIPAAARKAMASKLYQTWMTTKDPSVLKQLAAIDPKMAAALTTSALGSTRSQLPEPMGQQ